jgi:polysaccharide export outer membrane protein
MKSFEVALICIVILSSSAFAAQTPYLIGAGDVLEISVWNDKSLSRQVVVPPDRIIAFPLIGDIDVSRLTVKQLREAVTQKISDYVPHATVTVMINEINSLKAYVLGKVNRPGEYRICLDTSVMQILSMAGGLNPFADQKDVHILRKQNGKMINIPFDYKQVLKGKHLEQNITVEKGDVIVVP